MPRKVKMPKYDENLCASHVRNLIDPRIVKALIPASVKILAKYEYDALAFRGMSGCLYAAPLAYKLGKPTIMVRKIDQLSHAGSLTEGPRNAKRYIIVDDFISSGDTMAAIIEAVQKFAPEAECLGILLANRVIDALDSGEDMTQFQLKDHSRYDRRKR